MPTERIPFVLLAACCIGLAGCLQLEQEIKLEADGSGSFAVDVTVPLRLFDTYTQDAPPNDRLADWFDKHRTTARFAEAEGVELVSYRTFIHDGQKHLAIKGRITDTKAALESQLLGDWIMTKQADGRQTLAADLMIREAGAADTAEDRAALQKLFAGLRLVLVVRTPAAIIATTAKSHSTRRAEWIFDVADDDSFLYRLPEISVTFGDQQ